MDLTSGIKRPTHDNFKALPEDEQEMGEESSQVPGWK